jgi:two-component system chemotaxis sensor kinase CheA
MIDDPELRRLFQAESEEHLARLDEGLLRLEKSPTDQPLLEDVFRESHSLKGAARMLGLSRIEASAHGLESILNGARRGTTPLTPDAIAHMNTGLAGLRLLVQEALAGTPASREAAASAESAPAHDLSEQESVAEPIVAAAPAEPAALPEKALAPASAAQASAVPLPSAPFRVETVRIETRKLDELLAQVGELSVIQGRSLHRRELLDELLEQWEKLARTASGPGPGIRLAQIDDAGAAMQFGKLLRAAREALVDDSARLETTVHLLADEVHGMRLLPLANLFSLFPRMVRDLALEQGKEVELVIEGGDLTVDKRILEEMKDPLMHLLRNAIDHGIEQPVERERLGKRRKASLRLRAWREGAGVTLEVSEDGRGLNLEAIRQEAVKRGICSAAALDAMTPGQVQQIILLSGFSTSRYVTELSGRGVGLDVVRVNVERMKGSIRLDSQPGRGLATQLRLPLSVATSRLLLASTAGRLFGLPVEFVHSARWLHAEQLFTLEGRLTVLVDGQPVIAARLADLLELPQTPVKAERRAAESRVLACIVQQLGDEQLAVLADELTDEQEVVPKPLGAPLKRVRNVSALAMLGSGEICPVLNPGDLLRSAQHISAPRTSESPEHRAEARRPAVLLAEDSVLIRAMEKRILEDAHYEVVAAVDGLDAFNLLGSRSFAAVVSDIMMPNLDGLALTARIRAEPHYRDLPVILVTSLASEEDKRRGLEAGANAYIPKPSFDQRVLLDTLKRLI